MHAGHGWGTTIQSARIYWSAPCPATWASATPVLEGDPITWPPSPRVKDGIRLTMCTFVKLSASMWGMSMDREGLPSNTTGWSLISVLIPPPPPPPLAKKKSVPRLRTWRLKEPEAQSEYRQAFITETTSSNATGSRTEETWQKLKSSLLKEAGIVCGSTKKHWWWKETWWWNQLSRVHQGKCEILENLKERLLQVGI